MRSGWIGMALLGLLLSGCTADWDSTRTASRARLANMAEDLRSDEQDGAAVAARTLQVRGTADFASLPDRGELLAYSPPPGHRLDNRQAAYRVRLSEAHAFNAAHEGGKIVVPTPDGGSATFAYERHIEHPDGNWSWIGRDENGADAIFTFGEKAAFGTIPMRDGETLRLTTAAGVAWLAKNDNSKIAPMGDGKRDAGADVLLPPQAAGDRSQSETPGAHGNVTMAASTAAPAATAATIDVLLGYTNGLANALGGQSQAVTRMNFLVTTTNNAYQRSGITGRLRLVGTLMVNYGDDTDNGETLEALSGQTETGPQTPAPAFAALRAARETLGADLVALVRDFRTPQNNGCGIAWLIGGGQSGITAADAPFGYAVVGDGSDVDEGDGFTYFCREESLAHEFGHNMGQAHNQQDSNQSGVHAYSYGYREASATGFYTVMAYAAGENQEPIPYFANPNVSYQGRPTGVANASDNARSMNITMPIVATFRLAPILAEGAHNDVSGEGRSDLLWTRAATGQYAHWLMNGSKITTSATYNVGTGYDALGAGDIDGNGYADIIWRNRNTGQVYAWLRTAGGYTSHFISTKPAAWALVGVRDVSGDGKADLIWSSPAAGQLNQWLMNGLMIALEQTFAISGDYDALGAGDVNADAKADIVWLNRNTRQVYVWLRSGNTYTSRLVSTVASGWTLLGAGDVNNDNREDLLWSNSATGKYAHWLMNGGVLIGSTTYNVGAAYDGVGSGDFDANGYTDIVWMNRNTGQVYVWLRTASAYSSHYVTNPVGWKLIR